jgi:hypothetical protein
MTTGIGPQNSPGNNSMSEDVGKLVLPIGLVHRAEIFTLTESGGWALELQGMFLFAAVARDASDAVR